MFLIMLFCLELTGRSGTDTKISFWDSRPRKGANCMNEVPEEQWFKDAASIHLEYVRLACDKWDTEGRDFLLGDASDYNGLVKKDLEKLKEALSWADKYGLKVIVVPLSLPGCRWMQNNDDKHDMRLWEDFAYQQKAVQFWTDLASELRDYSCIVAYDLLNEPVPELRTGIEEHTVPGEAGRFPEWYSKYKGTPRDLYLFYQKMIKAIRTVDTETPVVVESGFYDQPSAYWEWPEKLEDSLILYSFHIGEPYEFTSANNFRSGGKYVYPGKIPFGSGEIWWDKDVIELYLRPFSEWLKKNEIPVNRVVATEFSCVRYNKGIEKYFEDVLTVLEGKGFHWSFYCFRPDGWDGYDYELGTDRLGQDYWQAVERGEKPVPPRKDNPLWEVIRRRLEVKE